MVRGKSDAFMAECLDLLQHALLQANKQHFHPAPLASDRYSTLETATKLLLDRHNPEGGEREATTIQRINQSYFRNSLLLNYQCTCCITGMQIPSMLIASHINPGKHQLRPRKPPYRMVCCSMHSTTEHLTKGSSPSTTVTASWSTTTR